MIMKKIKNIINQTWGIFINNFKVTMASLLVSLFWVIFLAVDEVKDTKTEIKIRTENAQLTNKVDLLLNDRNELIKACVELQGLIQKQNLFLNQARDIIQNQKETIDRLSRELYSTENKTTNWALK